MRLIASLIRCIFAAGTLRPSATAARGFEGAEELVARWQTTLGWQALHGPLRASGGAARAERRDERFAGRGRSDWGVDKDGERRPEHLGDASDEDEDNARDGARDNDARDGARDHARDDASAAVAYAARDGAIAALCVHGSTLYVGGGFTLRPLGLDCASAESSVGAESSAGAVSSAGEGASAEGYRYSRAERVRDLCRPLESAVSSGGRREVRFVAAWHTETSEWSALGGGVDAAVTALALDGARGVLFVSGSFSRVGALATPSGLAAWDGARWRAPSRAVSSLPRGARLLQLLVGGSRLFARSEDGSVHVLADSGEWSVLPRLPAPLRTVSTLAWLDRPLETALESAVVSAVDAGAPAGAAEKVESAVVSAGDAGAPAGAAEKVEDGGGQYIPEGQLLAAGDFVRYEPSGEMGGVVAWDGREWRPLGSTRTSARDGARDDQAPGGSAARHDARAPPEGTGVRWGLITALSIGVLPWGSSSTGLLAAGHFGRSHGMAWWRGWVDQSWKLVQGTGTVRALSLADRAVRGLETPTTARGPALRWPTTAPASVVAGEPMWVEVAPPSSTSESQAMGEGAVVGVRWESSVEGDGPSVDGPSGAGPSPGPAPVPAPASPQRVGVAALAAVEQFERRKARYGHPNDRLLLGVLLVLPPLFIAYYAVQARTDSSVLTARSRAPSPAQAWLTETGRKLSARAGTAAHTLQDVVLRNAERVLERALIVRTR